MEKTHLNLINVAATQRSTTQNASGAVQKPATIVGELKPLSGQDSDTGGSALLETAVKKINDFIQVVQRDLRFSVDETTGRTVVTVLDAETEEVIRQIPPEEVLSLAENLEEARGMLLKTQA